LDRPGTDYFIREKYKLPQFLFSHFPRVNILVVAYPSLFGTTGFVVVVVNILVVVCTLYIYVRRTEHDQYLLD